MKVILPMLRTTVPCALAAISILSACGGGGGGSSLASSPVSARAASVVGSTVQINLSSEDNRSVSNAAVGTAAFTTGTNNTSGQVVAVSGIAPGATVGPAITGGTATYATEYGYQVVDDVIRTPGFIRGDRGIETGNLTLTADFNAGTLTGSNSELTVNGTVNGTTVGGTVQADYNFGGFGIAGNQGSVSGPMNGQIGNTGVIAAFHGNDANTVMSGGLVGVKN